MRGNDKTIWVIIKPLSRYNFHILGIFNPNDIYQDKSMPNAMMMRIFAYLVFLFLFGLVSKFSDIKDKKKRKSSKLRKLENNLKKTIKEHQNSQSENQKLKIQIKQMEKEIFEIKNNFSNERIQSSTEKYRYLEEIRKLKEELDEKINENETLNTNLHLIKKIANQVIKETMEENKSLRERIREKERENGIIKEKIKEREKDIHFMKNEQENDNKIKRDKILELEGQINFIKKEKKVIEDDFHKISTQYLLDGSKDFLQKINCEKTIKTLNEELESRIEEIAYIQEKLRPFENNKFIFQIRNNKKNLFSINAFPVQKSGQT